MIAYGVCIGNESKFKEFALPGLQRVAEQDTIVLESRDNDSIFSAYNEMFDAVKDREDLECLVLLHEDTELRDPTLPGRLRMLLVNSDVAVIGAIGAENVRSLAWWDASPKGRCEETRGAIEFMRGTHEVEVVDGLFMALSPWAVRNLRFDETTFHGFHAYDMDFCLQAKAQGKHVIVTDIDLFHHTKGGYGNAEAFALADQAFKVKWHLEA